MLNSSSSAGIYFASLCRPISDWCSLTVYVPDTAVCRLTSVNNIQPHVVRCRELIFTEPDILATPLLHDKSFKVITLISLCRTGRLQMRLRKLGLECTEASALSVSDLEACLRYTLQAKLSPGWNKVGPNLIRGRDFLTDTSKLDAVRIELNVNHKEISISVHSHAVKVIHIKLCDLVCSESVLGSFIRDKPLAVIRQQQIVNGWCHVLPSMKKGCVVEIRHKIPGDSPFTTYSDMKKYWKNVYGYRLPESDDDLFYVQISFNRVSQTHFTYPSCCVLPSEPVIFGRADKESLSNLFMSNVTVKLTSICNSTSIQYTTPEVSQNKSELSANLTSFKPTGNKMQPATHSAYSVPQSSSFIASHYSGSELSLHNGVERRNIFNKTTEDITNSISVSRTNSRIVPVFNKTVKQPSASRPVHFTGQQSVPIARTSLPVVSKAQQSIPVASTSRLDIETMQQTSSQSNALPNPLLGTNTETCIRTLPVFRSQTAFASRADAQVNITSDAARVISYKQSLPKKSHVNHGEQCLLDSTTTFNRLGRQVSGLQNLACSPRVTDYVTSSQVSSQQNHKRKAEIEFNDGIKKIRSKPQVKHGIDISVLLKHDHKDTEALALWSIYNFLSKVNAATLLAWLKERGISCKNKDKKSDLVDKVLQAVSLNTSEQ